MKEFIYKAEKTIREIEKLENNNYIMKIRVFPYEAKMLLEKGTNVYEETIEFDGGCRKIYFIYCNIDALASVAQ